MKLIILLVMLVSFQDVANYIDESIKSIDPDTSKIDTNDPKVVQEGQINSLHIYISDQNDFETTFVREALYIPNDVLSGKLKPKYPIYLEQWLKARRELDYNIIVDPNITGPPLLSYSRYERAKVLAYPYVAVPDPVIFLKHLKYLSDLSEISAPQRNIIVTQTITFKIEMSNKYDKKDTWNRAVSFCVDDLKIKVSPLIDYRPHPYIKIQVGDMSNDVIIFSAGPTIEEQFPILDAGSTFLTERE